jgi:hypothetical protein
MPINSLLQSRKFLLLVLDTVISLVLLLGAKYLAVSVFDDVKFLIAAIQPIFVVIIGAIAYEDGQNAKAGLLYINGQPMKVSIDQEGQ